MRPLYQQFLSLKPNELKLLSEEDLKKYEYRIYKTANEKARKLEYAGLQYYSDIYRRYMNDDDLVRFTKTGGNRAVRIKRLTNAARFSAGSTSTIKGAKQRRSDYEERFSGVTNFDVKLYNDFFAAVLHTDAGKAFFDIYDSDEFEKQIDFMYGKYTVKEATSRLDKLYKERASDDDWLPPEWVTSL